MKDVRLHNTDEPPMPHFSDYGVPQNTVRVVFVVCRKDQYILKEVYATVAESEKANVYEAIHET